MTTIHRDTLIPGDRYDVAETCKRFAGWAKEGSDLGSHIDGFSVTRYFDRQGRYLGPDDDGIEPMFWPED